MSMWSRIGNVFRGDRVNREIDEELQSHIEEAIEQGRQPREVRWSFGSALQRREDSRDIKVSAWLDSLRADIVFGWRQLRKNTTVSGAAIVSLALAIGACTSAFRLIDALLLRPLPVAHPDRLYFLAFETIDHENKRDTADSFSYPMFRELRAQVKGEAELMAISYSSRIDLTYASDADMEKAYRQYVSGWTFASMGLKPALGRLLTAADDLKPGVQPVAVLSHDYWSRRFGRDSRIVGRTFRIGSQLYEIVGVCEKGFTGTETGTLTDIFLPTMMNAKAIENPGWGWFRTWVRLEPGTTAEGVRQRLQAGFTNSRRERAKTFSAGTPQESLERYINAPLLLERASAGVSGMQKQYRRALWIVGALVVLVLLIACVNVANLMTAQAASRAREMALRVAIGAGRRRLVQLVLVESAMLVAAASLLGGLFAWWSAPFVVSRINPPDDPARLILPADWRTLLFGVGLALVVTFLFGLVPALRASTVKPVSALKGGEDPHSRRRLMNGLVAAQVAFCFLVHFVAGLFVATFERMSNQPVGFLADRLLAVEIEAKADAPPALWDQVCQHLRTMRGVESAALSGWALMSGNGWSDLIWVNGRPSERVEPYFLNVSPGWMRTMRIPLVAGRDFRPEDTHPGAAIVNQAFARQFFGGENPVGKSLEVDVSRRERVPLRIVGSVGDVRDRNMREPIHPTIYVPFHSTGEEGGPVTKNWATIMVRTTDPDPARLASLLRREVPRARSEFRVSGIRTQTELVQSHTVRERLLAMLSLFFAFVALTLAGVGLYGVLNYSVVQRRKEIGIRMALGARASNVARRVSTEIFGMLLVGSFAGLAGGIASERFFEALLYQVRVTDPAVMAVPALALLAAALLAALPPVMHAVRVDPAAALRAE